MPPRSPAATEVARRLWLQTAGDAGGPEVAAAAAERLCAQLSAGLSRWIGADGYRVLFGRAVGLAQAEHPALRRVAHLGGDARSATTDVQAPGTAEVAAGMVEVIATLIDLLGRIIGEQMAMRLVEQINIPSPNGAVSTKTQGGRDG